MPAEKKFQLQNKNFYQLISKMHLAYSAIKNTDQQPIQPDQIEPESVLRFEAYLTVCEKYSREIAAIRQYLPGWQPPFNSH
jgi:hypothetical protein